MAERGKRSVTAQTGAPDYLTFEDSASPPTPAAAQGSRLAGRALAERRLRGREPGDRHPERRARDVVEADLVTERDRARVAAMLAADADLELAAVLVPP